MMNEWQQFIRHPVAWINLALAVFFNLASWGILLLNISPTPDLIVLHYTLYFGVDMVGSWAESLLIPLAGVWLIIVNTLFAQYFFKKNHIVSMFFLIMTPILEFVFLFAAIFLIIANQPAPV